jgi:WD40 repeat protein
MVNYYNLRFAAENSGDLGITEVFPTYSSRPHESSVDAITCDPTSDRLFASGSHDHTIKLWDANNPAKCLQTISGNKEGIWSLNYSADGKKLVSASPEGVCKVWDSKSGKCQAELRAHTLKAYCAVFSIDGNNVASCGSDSLVCYWDIRKPAKPVFVNNQSKGVVLACDILND